MKTKLLIVAFVAATFAAYPAAGVKFYNINAMYGISMREMASVCKDDNGFVWAAAKTGVMRLAGYDCRVYPLPYQTADIFKTNLVCKNSLLVAYSNNGQVLRYNALHDRFDFLFHLGKDLKNRNLMVYALHIDEDKNFWLSTSAGLYKYDNKQLTLTLTEKNKAEVPFSIWYNDTHFLYVIGDEIRLMDTRSAKSTCIYKNSVLSTIVASSLYYDNIADKLWIGTNSHGLFCYDFKTKQCNALPIRSFPKQPVRAIKAYTDSTLLVGIDGQGIWELSKKGNKVLNIYKEDVDDVFSLKGNGVYDILCDRDERVWVCTYSGGLSFFEQSFPFINQIRHQANNPNSLSNDNVNKVIEDSRGNIWFATDNGICRWNVSQDTWATFYHNTQEQAQVFLSLCEDNKGRIWAGTFSSGVYVIDGKTGKELAHYSNGTQEYPFSSRFVFDILKDSQGDLWLGGVMGNIICYVSQKEQFKPYLSLAVYAFAEWSPTRLLLASTLGLCWLDKSTGNIETISGEYFPHDLLLRGNDVWICTCGEGLIRFNLKNKTTEKFTTESGLPSNYINSIMEAEGYFWLGTENGLCRFNPDDKTAVTYSSVLPLSNVSFNRNAHCMLRNGQLIWGTNKGAILFNPTALPETQSQGQIFVQDILLSGHSIRKSTSPALSVPLDSLQELTLNYDQNTLTLELIPIGLAIAGAKLQWKIEGLDADWSLPSNQRMFTYTNIPAGNFKLKIRLLDSSFSQIIAEREILLSITPPFWETIWFRLLIFLLLASILHFSLRYYIDHLKQRHAEDKIRFFANTTHDIRTSLTLIKAPIEELSKENNLSDLGKHYLYLADEHVKRLSLTATHLLDFQKADLRKDQLVLQMIDVVTLITQRKLMFESLAKSRNIELVLTVTPTSYFTAIDKTMMEKVIDNLFSNAIKYSHNDSKVQIVFTGKVKHWTLTVTDQGIGIGKNAQKKLFREFYRSDNAVNSQIVGSGIGLLLVKTYVALHKGAIRCVSQENAGAMFKIAIPYKKIIDKSTAAHTNSTTEHHSSGTNAAETSQAVLPASESKAKEMSILIVEDNNELRNFMLHPLREEFRVNVAEDGAIAWKMIQNRLPDLVVSDVVMPNMDGFELCKRIKSTYETSHIPIILLTSLTDKSEQLHGLGLGADDYLTKPFDMALLSQRIKSIVRNRKTIREKALKLMPENVEKPIFANELNDKFVKKAIEVVHANISNSDFGKDEFASAMNVSTSLLYQKIKSLTDQSPVDFIKTIRLNYAFELLQSRKHNVTEVSELCGFSSINYFSNTFRKYFGKSPIEIEKGTEKQQ
ncbi:MAG: response regulator [Prevotellaceae bacterium]|jgi:signal transduction histidine kinase/ligand-binding sensor domain-containing protein/DNA-binding NarL/FixJ family response regulator|nr:response regulator [Prevotellaceae bacterium]